MYFIWTWNKKLNLKGYNTSFSNKWINRHTKDHGNAKPPTRSLKYFLEMVRLYILFHTFFFQIKSKCSHTKSTGSCLLLCIQPNLQHQSLNIHNTQRDEKAHGTHQAPSIMQSSHMWLTWFFHLFHQCWSASIIQTTFAP